MTPGVWRALGIVAAALMAADAVKIAHGMSAGLTGVDLNAPLQAARVALSGHGSIYRVPEYVYLPTSALLLTPVAHVGHALFVAVAYIYVAAVLAAVLTVARAQIKGDQWVVVGSLVGLYVLRSKLVTSTAYLENLNMLVVPFGAPAPALLLMRRGRWAEGCGLLAASILIKPVLAPLLLVPLLQRQWRPLIIAVVAAALITAAAAAIAPGGWHVVGLPSQLLGARATNGLPPVDNLTIQSLGAQHGIGQAPVDLARLLIAGIAALVCLRRRGRAVNSDPLITGYCIFLAILLAGRLYELSYGFLLVPLGLLSRGVPRIASALIVIGAVILFAPPPLLPGSQRDSAVLWLAGTVIAFGGLAWATARPVEPPGATAPTVAYDR